MKAITLRGPGGIENLELHDVPQPHVHNDQILVQTRALSVNPIDAKTRKGLGMYARIKDDIPVILGWDISGIVVETGRNVSRFKIGDEVFGMVNFPGHGKAYAELVSVPESHVALKPENISHEQATAASLAALTAWQALTAHAKVQHGQRVLIHAAAGGVGHFAVQIAKHLGAYVIGTSSAANGDFVLSLGADEHIDYTTRELEERVRDMDFVLDTIGAENIDRSVGAVRPGGTVIGIVSGRTAGLPEKAEAKGAKGYPFLVSSNGKDMKVIADLLHNGALRPSIFHRYPFDAIGDAHMQIETGKTRGKIIVHPGG
jgi:NADPH:quinone reductase-like Zn-dependent oxidoreductase